MTKILATLRSILKSLTTKAKISVSDALSVPGFLKVEVSYARDLTIARQSGRDARVNLDEILRRGVREGIILIVAGKMLARC